MKKKQSSSTSSTHRRSAKRGSSGSRRAPVPRTLLTLVLLFIGAIALFYFGDIHPTEWLPEELANSIDSILPESETALEGDAKIKAPLAAKEKDKLSQKNITARDGELSVIVFDIGQGNAVFVQTPNGSTMLVDAGERTEQNRLLQYLEDMGVTRIDAVVATHPHSDHIGGMRAVLSSFEIGDIYMPRVEHTTATYTQLLQQIKDMGKKVHSTKGGADVIISLDPAVEINVLAPLNDKYKSLNDYSIVLRISYGDQAILLPGDAQSISENEMLQAEADQLPSTVLLTGHHGSSTSTGDAFLDSVDPEIAIISCGEGNDYGHPHKEVLQRLKERDISVYRTDQQGNIAVHFSQSDYQIVSER